MEEPRHERKQVNHKKIALKCYTNVVTGVANKI